MAEHEIARAIYILTGLIVLVWWLYGPWQRFVVDIVRQQLFELRDHLFDIAARGSIPFDDPAYRYARWKLNAQIRFAHKATIWRTATMAPIARRLPAPRLPTSVSPVFGNVKWIVRRGDQLVIATVL